MYTADDLGAGTPEVCGPPLAAIHPRLRALFGEVWQMAHDRSLPLATQGVAKAWVCRMVTVLEAHYPGLPGGIGRLVERPGVRRAAGAAGQGGGG